MSHNFSNFEKEIDRYIFHEMSEQEEATFFSAITEDRNLRDRATIAVLLIKGIRTKGRLEDSKIIDIIKNLPI